MGYTEGFFILINYMKNTEKYAITSPDNFKSYELEGNNNYLNDINVESLKSGDKIVIAWEGGSKEVEIK